MSNTIYSTATVPPGIPASLVKALIAHNVTYNASYLEFLNESRDDATISAISGITALLSLILFLRFISRVFIMRQLGYEDVLALFTFILFLPFVVLVVAIIKLGSGRHLDYIKYVFTSEQISHAETMDFAAQILYTCALYVCRLSGLSFYVRICIGRRGMVALCISALAFISAGFIIQLFVLIFHCIPLTTVWPYNFQAAGYRCMSWATVYEVNSAISIFCDFCMFCVPAALIKSMQLDFKRKLQLAMLLIPGLLVLGISVTRIYLIALSEWTSDQTWLYDPLVAIEVSELSATLIALSIPSLKPVCKLCIIYMRMAWKAYRDNQLRRASARRLGEPGDAYELYDWTDAAAASASAHASSPSHRPYEFQPAQLHARDPPTTGARYSANPETVPRQARFIVPRRSDGAAWARAGSDANAAAFDREHAGVIDAADRAWARLDRAAVQSALDARSQSFHGLGF